MPSPALIPAMSGRRSRLQHALALTKPTLANSAGLSAYYTVPSRARRSSCAATACVAALEHWPAELVGDESLCLARLAVANSQLRHIEEACEAAQRAVDRVRAAPSARAIHMLRLSAHNLQPFQRSRSVAELTQALADVT